MLTYVLVKVLYGCMEPSYNLSKRILGINNSLAPKPAKNHNLNLKSFLYKTFDLTPDFCEFSNQARVIIFIKVMLKCRKKQKALNIFNLKNTNSAKKRLVRNENRLTI